MDPVTMIYYGCVCGLLASLGARVRGGFRRFLLGIAVGLAAAVALPLLRRAAGI